MKILRRWTIIAMATRPSVEVGQRPVQHAGNGDFIAGVTGVWGLALWRLG